MDEVWVVKSEQGGVCCGLVPCTRSDECARCAGGRVCYTRTFLTSAPCGYQADDALAPIKILIDELRNEGIHVSRGAVSRHACLRRRRASCAARTCRHSRPCQTGLAHCGKRTLT